MPIRPSSDRLPANRDTKRKPAPCDPPTTRAKPPAHGLNFAKPPLNAWPTACKPHRNICVNPRASAVEPSSFAAGVEDIANASHQTIPANLECRVNVTISDLEPEHLISFPLPADTLGRDAKMPDQLLCGQNAPLCLQHFPLHLSATQERSGERIRGIDFDLCSNCRGFLQGLKKDIGISRGSDRGDQALSRHKLGNPCQRPAGPGHKGLDKIVAGNGVATPAPAPRRLHVRAHTLVQVFA